MSIKDFLISCLFPKRCSICNEVINYNDELCNSCGNDLISYNFVRGIFCSDEGVIYNCISPFLYRDKVREIILKFKFHNHTKCVDFFSKEIAKCVYTFCNVKDVDYICFVPMTEKSIFERGYNQSEVLAKRLSTVMHISVNDVLVKVRETPVQHRLTLSDRKQNLVSAFSLRDGIDIKGKNFILCDDIVTTGCTLRECLRVLKAGGANKIICCTIATARGIEDENF